MTFTCNENHTHIFVTCRFVGLPNVGKSTLTNLLAGAQHAEAANYVSAVACNAVNDLVAIHYICILALICRISICN